MPVGPAVDTKPDRTGPDRTETGPNWTGPNRTGPEEEYPDWRSGQYQVNPNRTGPNRSEPDRTGPNRLGTNRTEWGEGVRPSRRTGNEQENLMDSMPYRIGLDHMRSKRTEPHQDESRRGMFIPDDARWTIIESKYELDGEGFLIRTERRRLKPVLHERHSQKSRQLYAGAQSPNEEPGQGRWSSMVRSTWNHPAIKQWSQKPRGRRRGLLWKTEGKTGDDYINPESQAPAGWTGVERGHPTLI